MKQAVVYDIIHGNIELSDFESALLKDPIINRLHQVLQTSTAYNVFPNMKHSRFEHSLGVLNYAGLMYKYGLLNAQDDTRQEYLTKKHENIRDLIYGNLDFYYKNFGESINRHRRNFLSAFGKDGKNFESLEIKDVNDILDSELFRSVLTKFIGGAFIQRNINPVEPGVSGVNILLFQSVRLLGMFHDIGHMPLSHLFEDALKGLFFRLSPTEDDIKGNRFLKALNTIVEDKNIKIHERIGNRVVPIIFQNIKERIRTGEYHGDIANVHRGITKSAGQYRAVELFIVHTLELIWRDIADNRKSSCFSSIYFLVSNSIDADRADFVQRDGYLAGIIKAAGGAMKRIINMYCLGEMTHTKAMDGVSRSCESYMFMPSIQSVDDVEELVHQRYRLYKYVIGHHAVQRSNHIFQKLIEEILIEEFRETDPTSDISDTGQLLNLIDQVGKLLTMTEVNRDNYHHTLNDYLRLTDYWLLNKLNKRFIELLSSLKKRRKYSISDFMLLEIHHKERNFFSLWKRSHEYYSFLQLLSLTICLNYTDDGTEVDEYSRMHAECWNLIQNNVEKSGDIRQFEQTLVGEQNLKTRLVRLGSSIVEIIISASDSFVRLVEDYFKKEYDFDVYVRLFDHLSTGLEDPLFLIDRKHQLQVHNYEHFSNQKNQLVYDMDRSIKFLLFYRMNGTIDKESIKSKLVAHLTKEFAIINNLKLRNHGTSKEI